MFTKVRFTNGTESTAGLVIRDDKLRTMSISDISRLFPYSECSKMKTIQRSQAYPTWEQAFGHNFDTAR